MIAGPYRHGSEDKEVWRRNHQLLNENALRVFEMGHTPVIGVNGALPIIEFNKDADYESIMMPLSLDLAQRCDAILRVGGPSEGADQEVAIFKSKDLPIYTSLSEIPKS